MTERMSLVQKILILGTIAMVSFGAGLFYSMTVQAAEPKTSKRAAGKVVYPKRSEVEFSGTMIEGEIRNPGEFYFQRRPEEKFDSLVKRRKNFHREILRDVVMTK